MTNNLKTALENGATRQLTISFPDDQALPDLTEEITEGSASFSRVLSSEDDLTFGATPAQFKFDANGIPDVAGKRIKATWTVAYEDEEEASVWAVPIFNGFVETAGIQPDRETREIVAYDVLKQARDLDVSARLRALFDPTVKAEYKGTYDPTASYSYGDVVLADGVHYRWLVKATDMIMVNDEPELVSDVLEGLTMAQIVSAYGQYVQAITDYDEYQYTTTTLQNVANAVAVALVGWSVENINRAVNRTAVITYNKEIEKMKAGEVLNAFAALTGGFVYVNPSNGRLRYVWLGSETVDFSNNYEAMNSTYSEYATPAIGKVEIVNDAGVIIGTYGSGTSILQVRNPLTYGMTPANAATYAQALHGRVSTYGYVSADLSSIVSFPLTPGTKLTVSTPTGESFQTFALEDSMSGVQMINQTVGAKGKATRTTEDYEPLQDYLNRKNAEEAARALEEAKRAEAQAWTNEVKAAQALEEKSGLYTTKVASPTGGFVYYMHDQETLAESEVLIEISTDAIRFSQDGGRTWTTELKIDGETITNILSAVGVNAEWINAGTLTAMTLEGTRGEIGGWNIQQYALMAEFISAVQNLGYQVVLRAPAQALYERDDVSTNNGTVEIDEETGQIKVVPETSGSCTITIRTNRLKADDEYFINWISNYATGDMLVGWNVKYVWEDGRTYSVNWSSTSRPGTYNVRYYLTAALKQRVEGSFYGKGTLTFTLPSAVAGTEYHFDVSMKIDDETITTWIDDDLPDGFSHDMILAVKDVVKDEIVYALYGSGNSYFNYANVKRIYVGSGEYDEPHVMFDDGDLRLYSGVVVDFDGVYKAYVEDLGYQQARLVLESYFPTVQGYELAINGYMTIPWVLLGGFLAIKDGKAETSADSNGNSVWLEAEDGLYFGRTNSKARVLRDEDDNGTDAIVVDNGASSGNVRMFVKGVLNARQIKTDPDSNGNSVWFENEDGLYFGRGGSKMVMKYDEDDDGNDAIVVESGAGPTTPQIFVRGYLREEESMLVTYSSNVIAGVSVAESPMRSGNVVVWNSSFSQSNWLSTSNEVKIGTITNQTCLPVSEVVAPMITDLTEYGNNAYIRITTSGDVYMRQYYAPQTASGRPSGGDFSVSWLVR